MFIFPRVEKIGIAVARVGDWALGGGGEEVLGDVDGGYCHYAGDGDDEAFVASDFYDVTFLVFEYAVEHSHFVAHRQVFVNHFQVAAPRFHGGSEHVDVALRDGAERLFAGHSVWPHFFCCLAFSAQTPLCISRKSPMEAMVCLEMLHRWACRKMSL